MRSAGAPPVSAGRQPAVRLIIVTEGGYDVQFLKRISRILHADNPQIPDLRSLEQSGEIIFVPCGGSNFSNWTHRLAGLRIAEFHLYDKEVPPLTAERQLAVAAVRSRPDCWAQLTGKRSLENYLHPAAICDVRRDQYQIR